YNVVQSGLQCPCSRVCRRGGPGRSSAGFHGYQRVQDFYRCRSLHCNCDDHDDLDSKSEHCHCGTYWPRPLRLFNSVIGEVRYKSTIPSFTT
ncbi:hypothetical protein B0H13DRAFT_2656100, partial [Mycena leptocephala]